MSLSYSVMSLNPNLLMPTVFQVGPYTFIFFSSDRDEPPHIHVKRDKQITKFWLNPISLEKNRGFREHELNQIARLVRDFPEINASKIYCKRYIGRISMECFFIWKSLTEHQTTLMDAWHDYFDT